MSDKSPDVTQGVQNSLRVNWKQAVNAATTVSITLSGEQNVDGVALTAGMRCLAKNQATPANSGIYAVQTGAWLRDSDCTVADLGKGLFVPVLAGGTANGGSVWANTSPSAWVLAFEMGSAKKDFVAAIDPTTTDDSAAGYSVGSLGVNTALDTTFICADATATAAVWVRVVGGPASTTDNFGLSFDGTSGQKVQEPNAAVNLNGQDLAGVAALTVAGAVAGVTTLAASGAVTLGGASAGTLELLEPSGGGTSKVTLAAPALAADRTISVPDADVILGGEGLAVWDFDVDGGAVGAYAVGTFLPDNAIVTKATYSVDTTCTSNGADSGELSIGFPVEAAAGVFAATAITVGTTWDATGTPIACIQDGAIANFAEQLTAPRQLTFTISVEDFLTGKVRVWFEYVIGG